AVAGSTERHPDRAHSRRDENHKETDSATAEASVSQHAKQAQPVPESTGPGELVPGYAILLRKQRLHPGGRDPTEQEHQSQRDKDRADQPKPNHGSVTRGKYTINPAHALILSWPALSPYTVSHTRPQRTSVQPIRRVDSSWPPAM